MAPSMFESVVRAATSQPAVLQVVPRDPSWPTVDVFLVPELPAEAEAGKRFKFAEFNKAVRPAYFAVTHDQLQSMFLLDMRGFCQHLRGVLRPQKRSGGALQGVLNQVRRAFDEAARTVGIVCPKLLEHLHDEWQITYFYRPLLTGLGGSPKTAMLQWQKMRNCQPDAAAREDALLERAAYRICPGHRKKKDNQPHISHATAEIATAGGLPDRLHASAEPAFVPVSFVRVAKAACKEEGAEEVPQEQQEQEQQPSRAASGSEFDLGAAGAAQLINPEHHLATVQTSMWADAEEYLLDYFAPLAPQNVSPPPPPPSATVALPVENEKYAGVFVLRKPKKTAAAATAAVPAAKTVGLSSGVTESGVVADRATPAAAAML